MSSRTEIVNLALSQLGEGKEIQNVDTDKGAEATAARRFLDVAIDSVLADFDWSFARVFAAFNLVATDPTTEWSFSYRVPSDCITFRRIVIGDRNLTPQNTPPFQMSNDSSGQLVLCDTENMVGAYTTRVANTAFFPADFTLALSYYLAVLMGPRITAGDPFKRVPYCVSMYQVLMSKARARDANQARQDMPPESEMIRAHGLSGDQLDQPRRS